MAKSYIYKVENKVNGKVYIGQTGKFSQRKAQHIYDAFGKKCNFVFHKALRKYGIEQFEWSIIWTGEKSLIDEMEMYFINSYKSIIPNGYNMLSGGKSIFGDNHPNFCKTQHTFYHIDGRIEENVTKHYMVNTYNLDRKSLNSVIDGSRKSTEGWIFNIDTLESVKSRKIKNKNKLKN